MENIARCPQCGTALADVLQGGHCPQCLVRCTFDAASNSLLGGAPLRCFGDYELLEEIARGGMGVVYRARQRSLDRLVAIKMLIAGEFASPSFTRRFQKEAQAAASLQHPNIVAVHEIGQWEGQCFFSMELVDGRDLADIVQDQPLPARRAASYLKAIAEAISFAHEKGVLHRDLKPSNILIDCFDQPRITDFGLAKRWREGADLTQTAAGLGSPAYMAPEQMSEDSGAVGPAVDIYSLGAVLYHLITGRPPFQGDALHQVIRQAQDNEPVSPRLLNPAISRDLETICLKCLEKDPDRRYPSARALAGELDRFLAGTPIEARPISRVERVWRWSQKNPMVATLTAFTAALLFLILAGSSFAAWRIELARRAEAQQRAQATEANVQLAGANRHLQESLTVLELQRAEQLFRAGDPSMGLAQLARVLRRDPSNVVAGERILSALLHRDWVLPTREPLVHPSYLGGLAFSASGRYLASGCADGLARIWDVRTGETLGSGLSHLANVRSVSFSPDESLLATACEDGSVRIWRWEDGELVASSEPAIDWEFSVAFSPDGERIVSGSGDWTAHVWSAHTGELIFPLVGHTAPVRQAVFSPDGQLIATASEDGSARLWNAQTGEPLPIIFRHPFGGPMLDGIAFSPDGRRLVTSSRDRTAVVWDIRTGALILPPLRHPDGLNDVQFNPTGRLLVTAGFDNTVRLWDARTGESVSQAFRHSEQVNRACFSPDALTLATASDDATVRFWETRPGQALEQRLWPGSSVGVLEFSPDGKWLASASDDHSVRIWDTETGVCLVHPLLHEADVSGICFSSDGRLLATAARDGKAWVWQISTGERTRGPFVHGASIASVSMSGKWLVTGGSDGTARIWDLDSVEDKSTILHHGAEIMMVRISPDGTRVATASADHTARVWDAGTGSPITGPLQHLDKVLDVQFSPDGLRVATASMDNTARIWDARKGEPEGGVLRHFRTVHAVAFSHDGRRVITASADHTARIWDASTGLAITPPLEHENAVLDARFSPDDQRVVTGSLDGHARLWESSSGLPVSEALKHQGGVRVVRFSPNGEKVATGASDRQYPLRIWDVPALHSAVPDWLPDLAEAVAGLPPEGATAHQAGFDSTLGRLRERLGTVASKDKFSQFASWFLADRSTRSVSPFSRETVPEYIQRRIQEDTIPGLEEALRLDPTNSLALARLARALIRDQDSDSNRADAANLARLALQFDRDAGRSEANVSARWNRIARPVSPRGP